MAVKGDKARLYDVAFRMYAADGKSLTEIEQALGVSRQTLSQWKADTRRPSDNLDEWDRAREQKRSNVQRLRALFDRELNALEASVAGSLTAVQLDAVTKLGSLVLRAEQHEAAAALKAEAMRGTLFLDFVRDMIVFAGKHDPALLQALEDNFDDMIAWGQEKYAA
ncbi:DUF1804 family protein [Desulfobulbus elongatus]|uniref:DUF1804 family protein n=1 Tax=Desulfobulbus elongatus TaxID=53332 RepID=UPI000480BBBB|nr:DUF1804 family protein [Desulfobulbus elongatus]